jgi:hypothetical protein
MARTRKLFPIYGSTLANNMLAALVHDRVVAQFVAGYVETYERRGILGGPARDRELAETIGREIILALIVEIRAALPRFFGKQKADKLRPEEKQAVELFFRELIGALDRAQHWSAEDRRQFRRDLKIYSEFAGRREAPAAPKNRRRAITQQEKESSFVARVALLLDPSMLEQARRAARKFHAEMTPFGRRLLRLTLG